VFIAGSLAAPVLLGMIVAAVASGDAGTAGAPPALSWRGPWLTPFAIAIGLFALALCAFLAAVYLTVEAEGEGSRPLSDDFRRRAFYAGIICGALALLTFLLSADSAPRLHAGLSVRRWSWPLHVLTGLAAIGALIAILARRYRLARGLAAAQVALVVLGWGVSQYPYLMPPYLTLWSASAPRQTQALLLIAVGAGAVVLFPSLRLLFRVFKSTR
jgi:cytochrome d ubiquinol oxidase subunit II